jgi:hypothetical protein
MCLFGPDCKKSFPGVPRSVVKKSFTGVPRSVVLHVCSYFVEAMNNATRQ